MKRPLGLVALVYGSGLLLGEFFKPPLPILFSCAGAVAAAALALHRFRHLLLWPLILFAGWTNFIFHTAILSPNDLRAILAKPELVTIRGMLRKTPDEHRYLRDDKELFRNTAQVDVTAIQQGGNWRPAFGRIVVQTSDARPPEIFANQTVEIYGVIAPPSPPLAEGLFDYRTFLKRQQIYFELKSQSSNDWRLVASEKISTPLHDRFRAWANRALALGLPAEDESLQLERALTLGDKTILTEEVSEPFVQAATYHIFAVDGLRMAIIFGIFFTLFRAVRVPRVATGLLLVPLIWFYVALTDWPASAIRAAVMLTIVIVGWALKRPSDLFNSLYAAALVILIWEPQQLFQAGFQLSFFVVLCILLILPSFDKLTQRLLKTDPLLPDELRPRWRKMLDVPLRFTLDLLLTSFAAWIGSLPLAAYYFHIVTPVSAPANLVAIPLCMMTLASNLISLMLAGWFPAAAEIFNHAGWFLMECIRVTSVWFAQWPGAYFYVPEPHWFTIVLFYLILLTLLTGWFFTSPWRAWKIAGLIFLCALWGVQWQHEYSATRLTILPLNGGSAVYFDAPGSKNDLLIDCGNTNSVERVTKPFLRGQGVNQLPALALTHGDLLRIGGTETLQTVLPIGQIATSGVRFRSPTYRRVVESLKKSPDRWRVLKRGDRLGDWFVLHPQADDHFPQADDNSLVLRGEFHGARILLLSDLGAPGQNALIERTNDLRADIVVTGLPQQGEPIRDELLDLIQPKLIIVTDSEFPATKRAGTALRERLRRRGAAVLYTRETGAVKISLQANQWNVSAMNGFRFASESGSDLQIIAWASDVR
ncbi:MAG: competence protein ComEC [Verrucomicrobiota bacterium]